MACRLSPVALNLETNVCFPYTSKHKDEENLHGIVSSRNQPNTAYLIFFFLSCFSAQLKLPYVAYVLFRDLNMLQGKSDDIEYHFGYFNGT